MNKRTVLLCLLLLALAMPAFAQRPVEVTIHTAEATNATGLQPTVTGFTSATVQVTVAGGFDGTATFGVSTDNTNYTAVLCRNPATGNIATTATAAGTYVCPIAGADLFRAIISGRTVGTITATAQLVGPGSGFPVVSVSPGTGALDLGKAEDAGHTSGDVGVMALCVRNDAGAVLAGTTLDYIPCTTNAVGEILVALPAGASATQVQGTAADGAAAVGSPVQTGGVDGAGNVQRFLTDTSGRLEVIVNTFPDNEPFNLAQIGGAAFAQGQRTTANSVSVTLSNDHGTLPALAANQSVNLAQVAGTATLTGGVAGSQGIGGLAADGAAVSGNPIRIALKDAGALTQDIIGDSNGRLEVVHGVATLVLADGTSNTANVLQSNAASLPSAIQSFSYCFNGTTWDRCRSGSATSTQPHYASALVHRAGGAFTFLTSTSHTVTTVLAAQTGLGGFNNLVVTWDVTAAERDSANETYDLYVTCGDGVSTWDVAHFPQIITTGAKRFTAFIHGTLLPQNVTTAVPGVAANDPGTFKTDTGGADQGTRTLAAGVIRHGALGDRCGADIVIAGTIVTGITHSLVFTLKP